MRVSMQILKGLGAEFLAPWRVWHVGIEQKQENRPGDQGRKSFLPDINEADVVGTAVYISNVWCMYTYIFLLIDLFITSLLILPAALGWWGRRWRAGRILPLQSRCLQDTSLREGTGWWAMGRGMQMPHVPSGMGATERRVPCFGYNPKTTADCEPSK